MRIGIGREEAAPACQRGFKGGQALELGVLTCLRRNLGSITHGSRCDVSAARPHSPVSATAHVSEPVATAPADSCRSLTADLNYQQFKLFKLAFWRFHPIASDGVQEKRQLDPVEVRHKCRSFGYDRPNDVRTHEVFQAPDQGDVHAAGGGEGKRAVEKTSQLARMERHEWLLPLELVEPLGSLSPFDAVEAVVCEAKCRRCRCLRIHCHLVLPFGVSLRRKHAWVVSSCGITLWHKSHIVVVEGFPVAALGCCRADIAS